MEEKFSYSKLDTFEQCGFKYYLKYVQHHNDFSDNIATELGSLVHETEETIANHIIKAEVIPYNELKNKFILKMCTLQHKYPQDWIALDKSGRGYSEKCYDYLRTGIYALERFMQEHPSYQIASVEKEFTFKYDDNHILRGFIDRVFYDTATAHYLIQDIKTYAVPVEVAQLATPLQFVVYTLAAEELFNITAEQISCQYYLPFCNLAQDAGTKNYMARGTKKLNAIFESIAADEFVAKPTPLCAWCGFSPTNPNATQENRWLCPYFLHWTCERKDFSKENEWQGLDKHSIILEAYHKKYHIIDN